MSWMDRLRTRITLLSVAALISVFPRGAAAQDPAVFTNVLDFDGQPFTHITFDPVDEHTAVGILTKYSALSGFSIEGGEAAVRHYTAYRANFFGDDGTEGGAVTGEFRIDFGYFGTSSVTVSFVEPTDSVGGFFGGIVGAGALTVILEDGRTVSATVANHLPVVLDGASACGAINGFLGIDSNGGPGIVQAIFSSGHDASSLDSIIFGTALGGSTGPGVTGFARVPYVNACGQAPIALPEPSSTAVAIDIRPGAFPNSINLNGNGTIPVAILGTPAFDVTTVDVSTVTLASAPLRAKKNGAALMSLEDINGDGFVDLIVHVETDALQLSRDDVEAVLKAQTIDGSLISGRDSIRIVP